jgi:hypothetical protein
MLLAVNQPGVARVAISMQHWRMTGYVASDRFLGTVLALAGLVVGVLAMLRIAVFDVAPRGTA